MKNWKIILSLLFLGTASLLFLNSKENSIAQERLPKQSLKIGVSLYRADDEFISAVSHSLEEESVKQADRFSQKMQLKIVDAKNSQTIQNTQIDEFIRQSYDVIAVNIVDRTVASSLIDKAKQADIPIIFFNREPIPTDLKQWRKAYYIGSKAQEAGEMQGQIVWQSFQAQPAAIDHNQDGKIQYVMLEGEEVHQDSLIRTESSIQAIVDEGIEVERLARGVGNWMRQTAKEFLRQWLGKYPQQIELVISNNDEMALGALEAIQDAKLAYEPKVVGIDGTKEGIEAVNEGRMLGTIINDYRTYAQALLTLAYVTSQGHRIEAYLPDYTNQYVWVSHQIYLREQNESHTEE